MNVIISRCLLGEPVRWHGRKLYMSGFVRKFLRMNPEAVIVPVCPELLGGLGVPRSPVKRRRGRVYITCADKARRPEVTGADVTDAFLEGARNTLEIAQRNGCTLAILCKWSPSCDATGLTGSLLVRNGIEVINTF